MAAPDVGGARSRLDRHVPGLGLLRGYRRAWLRADLVAGLVLAAILVPQGMAYAELAGLPPVTGLYTTIACLVGYALFGPSRVLVLGPDSSVSPLIFAAITPLLVAAATRRPRSRSPACWRCSSALIEIGLGVGKLGFVADLLSKEVQVGYMNGLGITIIVGQLPKLFGFSTDADGFVDELRAFVDGPRRDATRRRWSSAWPCWPCCSCCPASPAGCPRCSSRSSARPSCRPCSTSPATASTTVGALPQGAARRPSLPWTERRRRRRRCSSPRVGITLVSLTDTIATVDQLRGAPRRRGRPEPGDDRHRHAPTSPPACSRASRCRPAARAPPSPSSPAPRASSPGWSGAGAGRAAAAVPQLAACRPAADRPRRGRDRRRAVADGPRRRCAATGGSARARSSLSLVATAGVVLLRRAAGHRRRGRAVDPAVLPAQLVAARRGARPRRRLERLAQPDGRRRRRGAARASSSTAGRRRCSSPTPGCSASRSAASSASAAPRGSCCSARRSPTSTSPPPRCSSSSTTSSTRRACTWRSSSCATGCRTSSLRYGLFETLDRDHFYPSMDAALAAIAADEEDGGVARPGV